MKKTLIRVVCLIAFAALVVVGFKLWQVRPWRAIASVNGRVITASELDLRAHTLLDDAKRAQNLYVPKAREEQALLSYRREALKKWIVKEVFLSAALARGYEVTPADEQESLEQMAARLKVRNLTPEQYFKEGPISEAVKRREFKEGVLINKFLAKEVGDKINVTGEEIVNWQKRLQQAELLRPHAQNQPTATITRKQAVDSLRGLRYREGVRKLFRELYEKTQITCPEYPEMESLEGVSPSRPEDRAAPAPASAVSVAKPATNAVAKKPVITPQSPVARAPKKTEKAPEQKTAVKTEPVKKEPAKAVPAKKESGK